MEISHIASYKGGRVYFTQGHITEQFSNSVFLNYHESVLKVRTELLIVIDGN